MNNHVRQVSGDSVPSILSSVYVLWSHQNGDDHWKFLCWTCDNEALGFLERALTQLGFLYKVCRDEIKS